MATYGCFDCVRPRATCSKITHTVCTYLLTGGNAAQLGRLAGEWEVLENSFEPQELQGMFKAVNGQGQQQRLRAKL